MAGGSDPHERSGRGLAMIAGILRLSFLSLIILVLGQIVTIRGHTLSDQVRLGLQHTQHSSWMRDAQNWAQTLLRDSKIGFSHLGQSREPQSSLEADCPREEISEDERIRLRHLLRRVDHP